MTNRLTEQQLQEQLLAEFDAIDKIGRGLGRVAGSAAKGIGAVAGGVAGIPSAIKKGYDAGKQTVGGGGADMTKGQTKKKTGGAVKNTTSQTKSAEYQRNRRRQKKLNPKQEKVLQTLNPKQQQQLQTLDPTVQDQILNKGLDPNKNLNWFQKAVGAVDTTLNKTLDKVDNITSYDWRRGLSDRSNQDYVGAYGYQKLGKKKSQQVAAQNKIDKVTQQSKNKSGIGKGIDNAELVSKQKLKKKTDRQTAINNLEKFKNRKKVDKVASINKPPTKTKTDIAKKIRIGNQFIDPSDPKNANILKQVNKKTGT
jgi:hypothetical protein